jgi:riboflavin synthase
VSGHVDSTGTVTRLEKKEDGSLIYGVEFDSRYNLLIVEKGSITINGVSLTLVEVDNGYFSVSLIPLTQEWTNLGQSKI